jgi:hypothetical protein
MSNPFVASTCRCRLHGRSRFAPGTLPRPRLVGRAIRSHDCARLPRSMQSVPTPPRWVHTSRYNLRTLFEMYPLHVSIQYFETSGIGKCCVSATVDHANAIEIASGPRGNLRCLRSSDVKEYPQPTLHPPFRLKLSPSSTNESLVAKVQSRRRECEDRSRAETNPTCLHLLSCCRANHSRGPPLRFNPLQHSYTAGMLQHCSVPRTRMHPPTNDRITYFAIFLHPSTPTTSRRH